MTDVSPTPDPAPAAPAVCAADDPSAADRAAAVLAAGGAVVLPTDTVYGLAALPTVPGATARLFDLKHRAADQPLAVLVADAVQAEGLLELAAGGVDPRLVRRWMTAWWPGALTIVGHRSPAAAGLDLGAGPTTVGVRCPAHPLVRAIASIVGPIATTSANRSGQPTPTNAQAAAAALDGPVGLVIDGGPTGTVASTVVDVTADPWRVLRAGAVTVEDLSGV